MRKIKEILRLNAAGLSKRQIAKSVKASPSTVSAHLSRAEEVGLTWPLPEDLGEEDLMAILYPQTENKNKRPMPDFKYIHRELKRKSVTLQLLWEEYINHNPDGYRYSYFCELYFDWRQKLDLPLRQSHKAGEKVFVDFAGQTMQIIDQKTGEVTPAYIFIAVLGASNYIFARGVFSCNLDNWVLLHCQVFESFGGAPEIIVPDNLRTAVTKTCRYEPDINPSFQEMAEHYGCAVIPGRPYKPKDKAKAENAVLFVERQILARLRNRIFFSLEELNNAIDEELIDLNERPFQKLEGSRKSWFETVDKPALKPLPPKRFEFASWKSLLVNIDYHVQVGFNLYSAPFQLVKEKVDVRITPSIIEIFHKGKRVTSHQKLSGKGKYSTYPEHMPPSHRKHLEWTPARIINWAEKTGTNTAKLVQKLMEGKVHPEQAYRSCLGVLRLAHKHGEERVEAACERALSCGAISYRSIKSILEKGLDKLPLEEKDTSRLPDHDNIRGASYYKGEEDT